METPTGTTYGLFAGPREPKSDGANSPFLCRRYDDRKPPPFLCAILVSKDTKNIQD